MDMDSAYQNGTFIKDADGYMPHWQAKAQAFRAAQGLRMGQLTSDLGGSIDVFYPKGQVRGWFVFIHGGYWMRFPPRDFSHLAQGALARG